jgi:tetratricopeptide (TPR) repeat protein
MNRPPRNLLTLIAAAVLMALVTCLAGFNAWWYWRDHRPVPDLETVAVWMSRQQYAQAELALRERLRRSPIDGEARIDLARVLAARNDLLGCARQLHQVPSWWPTKNEALYREGSVSMMLGRAKDAEAAWQAVVRDDPLHPGPPDIMHDATYGLLELYATEDRWEDAHVVLWRAYDEAALEDRPQLLAWRLRSELERVAPLETVPILRRYVAAVPDDWEALRSLARAELALGRKDVAERHFQACMKARPDDPRVWRDYLTMLHEQGEWDAFSALLARAPRAVESEPEIWKFRGMMCEKNGNIDGAAENYRQAIERNPNVLEYHYRLAVADERLGQRAEAAEHRKRTQQLREASAQLPKAYHDFLDAQAQRSTGGPDLATSIKQLASICETLGFARAAEGWNRLLDAL